MSDPATAAMTDDEREAAERRRIAAIEARRILASEAGGAWVDGEDVADRQAFARSRSADAYERPPHY